MDSLQTLKLDQLFLFKRVMGWTEFFFVLHFNKPKLKFLKFTIKNEFISNFDTSPTFFDFYKFALFKFKLNQH